MATGRYGDELRLHVVLLNGQSEEISVSFSSKIADVKVAAQQSLGKGFLKLLKNGRVFDPDDAIADLGLQQGDTLHAVAQAARVATTSAAFAVWCPGGSVVTWGDPCYGGDSSRVQSRLKDVQSIHGTGGGAFAAILGDRTVVTWGNPECGGDSTGVQDHLIHVHSIAATDSAFAAIIDGGRVITWGHRFICSHSSKVQHDLINVQGFLNPLDKDQWHDSLCERVLGPSGL